MTVAALVLAALAAAIHVYIWWLESVTWMTPRTRAVFGIASEDDARVTRGLAFNQGFYNLFLAVVTAVGIVLLWTGSEAAGAALVYAGCGSMAAAAAVLLASGGRTYSRAAAVQGALPALALILLTVGLLAG
ncbi:DUF1304 domain-containing protein [Demequina sp. SYSU T00068]|uniref:DUF1304 domain-containing protein n=1 Tax=Demequina lignilytica TaxID=3051663 RepID=UPI002616EE82|nr:DUF1304 domain-containing protein [Demequina sp. SYSU T00068]MDN4490978.1 DUF1304 domain-containing protein [Demequina sp. SYSU T00068]